MKRYYTGVGHRARNVAPGVEKYILWLSAEMAKRDINVVSGDADGIDEYFERNSEGKCKIYLPYKRFGHYEGRDMSTRVLLNREQKDFADSMLSYYDILPEILTMHPDHKKYHRRNFFQVWNEGDLVDVLFYYAKEDPDGTIHGGTRTAVYTARHLGIPCYNLYTEEQRDFVEHLVLAGEWD